MSKAERAAIVHGTDFYDWSQDQARLLRSLPSILRDMPAALDIENVAGEIEDLGKAELNAVESQIRNIFVHLLKAVSDPQAQSVPHWRTETTIFHAELVQRYSPSMRQRIDLAKAWRLAIRIARDSLSENGRPLAAGLPADPPLSVDDLASEAFGFDGGCEAIVSRLEQDAATSA